MSGTSDAWESLCIKQLFLLVYHLLILKYSKHLSLNLFLMVQKIYLSIFRINCIYLQWKDEIPFIKRFHLSTTDTSSSTTRTAPLVFEHGSRHTSFWFPFMLRFFPNIEMLGVFNTLNNYVYFVPSPRQFWTFIIRINSFYSGSL